MKRTIWFMLLAMAAASLLPFCAHAQVGPPGIVGTVTAGHCVSWHDPGNLQDAGANCGGTGAPGGSNFSIQYNNTGAFGGLLPGAIGTYCIQWSSLAAAPVLTTSCGTATPPGSNTQVIFNNSGAFGASSNFTWNSGSNVLNLGASTTPGTYSVGVPDSMTISGTALAVPGFSINSNIQGNIEAHSFASISANGSIMYGARARGTIGIPSAVVNGDNLLTLGGAGFDGTNYDWGAHIHFQVDGTPGLNVMPGGIDLQVVPAASNTPQTALFLHSNGSFGVNGSQGAAGQALVSNGTGAAAAWGTTLSAVTSVNGSTIPASAGTLPGSTGAFTLNDCLKVGSTAPLEIADAGAACGSGSGAVSSVSAGASGSVSVSPTTGAVVVDLASASSATVLSNISGSSGAPISNSLTSFQSAMIAANAQLVTATAPTGPTNDYSPTGYGTTTAVLYLTPTAGGSTINGLVAGSAMQQVFVVNAEAAGGADNITLVNQAAGSLAANRFLQSGNLVIPPGGGVDCVYLASTITRWWCH